MEATAMAAMGDITTSETQADLEEELLGILATQARRVLVPVFLVAVIIASFAADYVPRHQWIGWLAAVLAILLARALIIPWLSRTRPVSRNSRLGIIMALSLLHGLIQAYSLTFFAHMGILEQSMQTMLLSGMCMGAVATSAGHLPFFLAFVGPIMLGLLVVWTTSLGGAAMTQMNLSVGIAVVLFLGVLISVAHNTYQQFRHSFEIRRKQVELNRQLKEASDAKTRFLATASHDLRQPMQALSASIEALHNQDLDEESRRIVEDLVPAKDDLSDLLRALLDISRLDAGVEDFERRAFDLHRLLFSVWDEQLAKAEEKGLSLGLDCPEEASAISNPVQFKRIIGNLVANAIRYTDTGSVRIECRRDGAHYRIDIADTGIGIDEREQVRIFDDFYQACYPSRSHRRGGLGLGLSIVRRLTQALELPLSLRSAPGAGSTFSLEVPAAALPPHESPEPSGGEFEYTGLRVLVVDDEPVVASALRNMLVSIGCVVETADGTSTALDIATRSAPDVVMVDRRLLGEDDGLRLIERLRAIYPDMPAILISGDTSPERIQEAEAANVEWLVKPAPLSQIKDRLAAVCSPD
ncbi:MAG: hybrid sensor histidine kinase/response regulator [Gammaproteobacteria bacterium]